MARSQRCGHSETSGLPQDGQCDAAVGNACTHGALIKLCEQRAVRSHVKRDVGQQVTHQHKALRRSRRGGCLTPSTQRRVRRTAECNTCATFVGCVIGLSRRWVEAYRHSLNRLQRRRALLRGIRQPWRGHAAPREHGFTEEGR